MIETIHYRLLPFIFGLLILFAACGNQPTSTQTIEVTPFITDNGYRAVITKIELYQYYTLTQITVEFKDDVIPVNEILMRSVLSFSKPNGKVVSFYPSRVSVVNRSVIFTFGALVEGGKGSFTLDNHKEDFKL